MVDDEPDRGLGYIRCILRFRSTWQSDILHSTYSRAFLSTYHISSYILKHIMNVKAHRVCSWIWVTALHTADMCRLCTEYVPILAQYVPEKGENEGKWCGKREKLGAKCWHRTSMDTYWGLLFVYSCARHVSKYGLYKIYGRLESSSHICM